MKAYNLLGTGMKAVASSHPKLPKPAAIDGSELEWRQIPCLREGDQKSPVSKKMEKNWDNRCYRISMINSVVHKHYRTLFEHITANKKL